MQKITSSDILKRGVKLEAFILNSSQKVFIEKRIFEQNKLIKQNKLSIRYPHH